MSRRLSAFFIFTFMLLTASIAHARAAGPAPAHDHAAMLPAETTKPSGFNALFETYIPRRICMYFESDVIWTHVISDTLIAVSYFTIPITLIYIVRRRKDIAFSWMLVSFAIFILACGATHVFSILAVWNPLYRLEGYIKAITAAASILTAIALWRLTPRAIALPSHAQIRAANEALSLEIAERKNAEASLRAVQSELEQKVHDRTAQLESSNTRLLAEIDVRKSFEVASARHAAIVASSDDAIIGLTLDGVVTDWNRAAQRLFGYAPDEIVGKSIMMLVPPERTDEEKRILAKIRGDEHVEHFETVRVAKNGTVVFVSLSVSPIKNQNGQIIGASKIARDVTAQKAHERERIELLASERLARLETDRLTRMKDDLAAANEQLLRTRAAADAANRAKSDFLANMSHEIRTPMSAIIGYTDLLLDARLTPGDQLDYINTIRRNGDHLLTLINDTLDLAKIESGKIEVSRIPCSPCQILSEVASLMRVHAAEKRVKLEVKNDGPVPLTVRTDPARLRQVLINLVGNAIKFTDDGWVRVIMTLDEQNPDAPKLRFDVIDTGIGMTEATIARLFQPFVQGDASATRRFGGTGLGLTIGKRFAEMLGGGIGVHSTPGRGSTFSLVIDTGPLAGVRRVQNCGEALAGQDPNAAAHAHLKFSGRILLVEDGDDNRKLLSLYLTVAGATVTVAENGRIGCEKALAASAAGTPFDLIFLDMQMPELDGYGAAARLRAKGYTGPIIALTAHAMADDRAKCLNAGCTDYLSKPVRRDQFLLKVLHYLPGNLIAGERPAAAQEPDPDESIIRCEISDPDLLPLLNSYVEQLPGMIRDFKACRASGDLDRLSELAHNLSGTGGTFGFMPITRAATELEQLIANHAPLSMIHAAVQNVISTIRRVEGFNAEQK